MYILTYHMSYEPRKADIVSAYTTLSKAENKAKELKQQGFFTWINPLRIDGIYNK